MYGFFESPYRLLTLSRVLLIGGLIALIVGAVLAYGLDQYLSLPNVVVAHAMTILGPTAIKLGYVMRLLAFNRLRREPGLRRPGLAR
ncbi:transmembrane sensor/regulator PpyR [Pseudomonas sp. NPDC089569]|uniref:transmembrane sensor/regulator PpyR n=1 Tax=Pseudomonas sp. NPDC089569 TaxID=3390722 RepID=UPI003D014AA6